jgi:hypothetical protein
MSDALKASGEDLLIYGYPLPSKNGYLSAQSLDLYAQLFDKAEQSVKTNPAVYARVVTARLPLQFALLEQAKIYGTGHRGFYHLNSDSSWALKPEMTALLDTFVVRCKRAGIERLEEHGTSPDEYLASTMKLLNSGMKRHLALFRKVILDPPASPKYHAGDAGALTDGLKGWEDYHMNWLGFEGEDMVATIDLGIARNVKSISTEFLQDINSWVFMPLRVEFLLSEDGVNFRQIADVKNKIYGHKEGALIEPFETRFNVQRVQYVRVKAISLKTCPNWHKGAGGLAWIFADEIVVE